MSDTKKTLHNFLYDVSDQSKADAVKELESHGVEVPNFFSRIQRTVQSAYMSQLGNIAAQEQAEAKKQPSFMKNVSDMTKEQILALVEQIRSGVFGSDYGSLAIARCRNNDPNEMTVEELRSWLEDLGDTLGEAEE